MGSTKVTSLNSAAPPTSQATPRGNAESTLQNRFLMALHAPKESTADDTPSGVSDMAWWPFGLTAERPQTTSQPLATTAEPEPSAELTALLERVCSAMYVSERSVASQRIVLALDHALPGAAAEIVREGVHLTIRLHARTDSSYRLMSLQREALSRTLGSDRRNNVDVIVVRAANAHDYLGDADG